jgi:hypothetical protein
VEDCFDASCVITYNIQSIGRTLKLRHINPNPLASVIMLCNSLKFELVVLSIPFLQPSLKSFNVLIVGHFSGLCLAFLV